MVIIRDKALVQAGGTTANWLGAFGLPEKQAILSIPSVQPRFVNGLLLGRLG